MYNLTNGILHNTRRSLFKVEEATYDRLGNCLNILKRFLCLVGTDAVEFQSDTSYTPQYFGAVTRGL